MLWSIVHFIQTVCSLQSYLLLRHGSCSSYPVKQGFLLKEDELASRLEVRQLVKMRHLVERALGNAEKGGSLFKVLHFLCHIAKVLQLVHSRLKLHYLALMVEVHL